MAQRRVRQVEAEGFGVETLSGIWSMERAPGRASKWTGASTWVPAWSLKLIDSALDENSVAPARFFSSWSYQVATTTGGCDGCTWVRWKISRLRSISSMMQVLCLVLDASQRQEGPPPRVYD